MHLTILYWAMKKNNKCMHWGIPGAVKETDLKHMRGTGTKWRWWALWWGGKRVSWRRRQELLLFNGRHKGWYPENRKRSEKPRRNTRTPVEKWPKVINRQEKEEETHEGPETTRPPTSAVTRQTRENHTEIPFHFQHDGKTEINYKSNDAKWLFLSLLFFLRLHPHGSS